MRKIERKQIEFEEIFKDKVKKKYGYDAYWTEDDPFKNDIGAFEAYENAIRDSVEWTGAGNGFLTIASTKHRAENGGMLCLSFPLEDLYEIAEISQEGRPDAIQIISVKGDWFDDYRCLTISSDGGALMQYGFFKQKKTAYKKI